VSKTQQVREQANSCKRAGANFSGSAIVTSRLRMEDQEESLQILDAQVSAYKKTDCRMAAGMKSMKIDY
jgi:hypothetical protein